MIKLFAALVLALPLAAGTAFAQDKKAEAKKEEKKEMTPQQKKLGECSAAAKGLKGDEYDGWVIKIDGNQHQIMREQDVLAVLEEI